MYFPTCDEIARRLVADVAIEWENAPREAAIAVTRGEVTRAVIARGRGDVVDGRLSSNGQALRLDLSVSEESDPTGGAPAMLRVRAGDQSFTFFVRDVDRRFPILLPEFGVAVTTASDARNYAEILQQARGRSLSSNYQRIAREPEESFIEAAAATRRLEAPIWLGVGRDVRIFEMGLRRAMHVTDYVTTRWHGYGYFTPDIDKRFAPQRFGYVAGRGWHSGEQVVRRLDEGSLPILHVRRLDDDVQYDTIGFSSLEKRVLADTNVRGTHWLVADGLSECCALDETQRRQYDELVSGELEQDEETVFCCRITAKNTSDVPRYAWFKSVHPIYGIYGSPFDHDVDAATGFARIKSDELVYAVSRLNGRPLAQREVAVLVPPGETCTYEFILPHRPISALRAGKLFERDVATRLEECRSFWRGKLASTAKIELPEKRIEEMLRACLLQMDLVTYGIEPHGPTLVASGVYSAVCAEVIRNIQFYDSMGWHDLARRSYDAMLGKQQENGFIQNFAGYMLDTGCVMHGMAMHYRYTRDDQWRARVADRVERSCRFLIEQHKRAQTPELRGKGYGMMPGKVADPEDNERIYMLNAYAYAGLLGAAQLLDVKNPSLSGEAVEHARALRNEIREAFAQSLADGPVIPMADGTWTRSSAPWVGPSGPVCLCTEGSSWWSHGSMTVRDDILGAMHLITCGVLEPREPWAQTILNYSNELLFSRNLASSQPYYLQHPILHLYRGETKAFLKAFYNGLAALADRETYSWWEHFFHVSPHKTSETAAFLMQARSMLWLEVEETLSLLAGIPRIWMQPGERIVIENAVSQLGRFSLRVEVSPDGDSISAHISLDGDRSPSRLRIRLPDRKGRRAITVEGGDYDADSESVTLSAGVENARISYRAM